MSDFWTGDRIEKLRTLWKEGLPASWIAAELGAMSRNAVIGKAHRLGLSPRVKTQADRLTVFQGNRKPPASRQRSARIREHAAQLAAAPVEAVEPAPVPEPDAEVVPLFPRVPLTGLTGDNCHWPIGDPLDEDFAFCGGSALDGMPYCAHHARIAYTPSRNRQGAKPGPKPHKPSRLALGWNG